MAPQEAQRSTATFAARQAARQAVIDRYGSEYAARAPTERERAILSRKPWPMPTTYAAAVLEQAEWTVRDQELADLDTAERRPGPGESLSIPLQNRASAITNLVEVKIPLRTLAEIHDRMRRFALRVKAERKRYGHEEPCDRLGYMDYARELVFAAVVRDLGTLVDYEASRSVQESPSDVVVRIAAALSNDPSASDRHIARLIKCSPTTVGKVRVGLRLETDHRTVRRGGQIYGMVPKRRPGK